jgi:hypothetical protein
MQHLQNALQIGDTLQLTGLSYCPDDNTYTPYTYTRKAWACAMRSRLPQPPEPADLFAEMFGV